LKFQAVAEKTAKDGRGLLYFAAPGTCRSAIETGRWICIHRDKRFCSSMVQTANKRSCRL